ncbi:MAG: hypothetical protein JNK55_11155 [Rubrivivax sp.]|nr:hypothetical protein [Rubrivivax sp.]
MNLENKHNNKLERLGFSFERGGVHTARTMMLAELRALLSFVDAADAAKADLVGADPDQAAQRAQAGDATDRSGDG